MPHRKSPSHRSSHAVKIARMPPAPIDGVDIAAQIAEGADKPDGELRDHMIAEAAYYRALNRGFNGGDPNEDWYAAEHEIDERHGIEH
ncbi:MAG: DUF2934 domain-containing protein [Sinimarinibacterium sp.]|jgi:hypothetical protein